MDTDDPLGLTNVRSIVLGNVLATSFVLFPIIAMLFFDADVPLALWFGYAWGLVAGILSGLHLLRGPNPRQRLKRAAYGAQRTAVIGIAVGGSGLAYSVMMWWFGENLTFFLVFGGCMCLTVFGWFRLIAWGRTRSE